ncbi:hypothetical protein yrohd0001_32000 [Yersinia rohdei ATCC 43380]|nr:hypothetical protein yrohd0001_32000 [Yersinia rohdei ATCC 43380]
MLFLFIPVQKRLKPVYVHASIRQILADGVMYGVWHVYLAKGVQLQGG